MPYRQLKIILVILFIIFSTACNQAPTVTPASATPVPIIVQIDPALAALQPAVAECSSDIVSAVVFSEFVTNTQENRGLVIGYAKNIELPYQFLLGSDTLGLAMSNKGSVNPPTIEQLKLQYQASSDSTHQRVGLIPITYPETNIFRILFDDVFLTLAEDPHLLIAPDPESMRTLILEDSNRIGYLPESWIYPPLAQISLPSSIKRELQLDIIAALVSTPDQSTRRLIDCLQSGAGQKLLAEVYLPFQQR